MRTSFQKHGPAFMIAALFLCKALLLAFWFTPLWDITDEIGHYAYALDLAEGRGVPLLGEASIGPDVIAHMYRNTRAPSLDNWIAQHPPVFYWIAAVPLKIGLWVGADPETLYRLPRIVAAICGALALLALYAIAGLIGLGNVRSTALMAMAGSVPGFTHLASGISHDVPLFLFSAIATCFLAKYMLDGPVRHAYACAAALALAAGTKMTALVLLLILLVIVAAECKGTFSHRVRHVFYCVCIAFSIPSYWLIRQWRHFGNPFYTDNTDGDWNLTTPLTTSLIDFLREWPVINHFEINFIGVFGWLGTGGGRYRVLQIQETPLLIFSCALLFLAGAIAWRILLFIRKARTAVEVPIANDALPSLAGYLSSLPSRYPRLKPFIALAAIALCAAGFFLTLQSHRGGEATTWIRLVTVALLWGGGGGAVFVLFNKNAPADRLLAYGSLLFTVFCFVLLREVYGFYLLDGRMRATWGRYLYPVAPILFAAFCVAIKEVRIRNGYFIGAAIVLVYFELETFVGQVLPFYMEGQ